ncbi:MAG TPA: PAS domain-containing protein [Pyrinomonadaceae bacterium]|nr:PAS domain-containing protein [Pyrinomonadaceae bacterium]
MEAQLEHPTEEIKRLQRCINDLVSVTALPAIWGDGEPTAIVRTLLESLLGMLSLDLIYVRLEVGDDETPIEMFRVAQSLSPTAGQREIGELFDDWLGDDPLKWPPLARISIEENDMTVVPLRLGLQAEIGALVAVSRRPDFPRQTERLVLSVAANQAAIGLQQGRKRAEEALAASERNLKLTIDTMPALAWSTGHDGSADFFNQHYLDYVGLTAEQAGGWGWTAAVHPDDLNSLAATWGGIMVSGAPGEAEARIRRHDGEYRWFLFRANPLHDESGNIVKWYGTNTDIDDRKRAEDQLQLIKYTIDHVRESAVWIDSDARFIFANDAACNSLGYTREELLELTIHDIDPNFPGEAWPAHLNNLRVQKSITLESIHRRKDGSTYPVELSLNYMQYNGQEYHFAFGRDITERKQREAELKAKQELLDLAQKSARAMAFDWHIEQDVNVWSPEQEALYGLHPGSFDGTYQSWKKLIYAPDWPLVVKAIKHAHETGEVAVEFRVQWPDGSLHWLATNGQMFFDEQGKAFRMVGFTSDVTPRKLAEEELRRSGAFLAEAQHLSLTGSFSWRVETDEITWSEQAYHIFELDPASPMPLELIRTRVHPDDTQLFDEVIAQARAGGDFEYEHRLLMPDHSIKYLHVIAHETRGRDDELEYVGAVQDVTERRLSEEALGKLRSQLAHVSRVATLGALTASIAHEVNQPLAGIITNASTCLRMLGADPPNLDGARETLRRTIRDGHRAADVITRLRALFSRKGAPTESVDLNEAAREVIALLQSELQRSGIILRTELSDDLQPVTGDRIQLQQVILNLLRNGADAMSGIEDRPRQLVIRSERDEGDRVRLSVQDAGVGLDPQGVERLFDAFYTTKSDGMGIGLSVSRSIIERHQGRLWAASNDGHGATFSFSIPLGFEEVTSASGIGATRTPASKEAGGDARSS